METDDPPPNFNMFALISKSGGLHVVNIAEGDFPTFSFFFCSTSSNLTDVLFH